MNILFVTGMFAKNKRDTALSGMPNAVYKSAVGMQLIGHKVRILTVDNRDARWVYRGIRVVSVCGKHGLAEKSIVKTLYCIIQREINLEKVICKLHKEEPIDIIQYVGWFGIGMLHYSNIPAVMRISSYTKIQLFNNYNKNTRFVLEMVEYLAALRMNYIYAPSRIMAEGMEKDLGKKVGVIETPYLQENFGWNEKIWSTELYNKRYIFFFGRMSVDKGILVIKDIIYRVLEKYPNIYFVFAGISWEHNGIIIEEELCKAAKQYKERVIFLGLLSKDKLMPVINNAEIILMPSLADNFPNACAEAMALGKIVIGTDGSSLEQFIKDGYNGYLAEIGNSNSLFSVLERVFSLNEQQREIIADNARKRVKRLDLERYSQKMELIYSKIIGFNKEKSLR
ncbi:MAG: glycosyltransferase family 4 protein [Ruminococcus flavefaciens]|nr:glycosyltransferase family 4 protein [Eubacterium sp.]MCM1233060.1 glycosyltransferase family 4 protein [Ruminococcus flavefaciens]